MLKDKLRDTGCDPAITDRKRGGFAIEETGIGIALDLLAIGIPDFSMTNGTNEREIRYGHVARAFDIPKARNAQHEVAAKEITWHVFLCLDTRKFS